MDAKLDSSARFLIIARRASGKTALAKCILKGFFEQVDMYATRARVTNERVEVRDEVSNDEVDWIARVIEGRK